MGRKLGGSAPLWGGGAESPSNTMWPGPRPTCKPSFILIHPTVWPQCTNVTDRTDRQTGQNRQWTNSIGQTVLQTVAQKRFALCYQTIVCTVCLSVMLVHSGQTVGWIKMKLGMQVGLVPRHIVLDGQPAPTCPLPQRGTASSPPNFRPISLVAK